MNKAKQLLISMLTLLCCCTGAWASSIPGALSGRFTINASGEKVLFSQGNLQYQASTNTWRFATNQYDYIGSANANISDSYTGWIDLFGWATNGLEANTATGKMPYYTGTTNEDYGPSITSGEFDKTIYDWGKAIDDSWHTLSNAEWNYIFTGRANYSSLYGFGRLFGVNGVFLLPDDWSWSETSIATAATAAGFAWSGGAKIFSSNIISNNTLWSVMESAGAVFIPAAGYRQGTTTNMSGNGGDYWSSTASSATNAYRTSFYDEHLNLSNNYGRSDGISVRLVRSSLEKDGEGNYLLSSAQDWKDFATLVQTTSTANAKMTADIDVGTDQTMIPTYRGIFDGQGHTLMVNLTATQDGYGPFLTLDGATIKNLHVTGTITNNSYSSFGGIVGYIGGTVPSTITNCRSSVTLKNNYSSSSPYLKIGGVVGGSSSTNNSYTTLDMSDCLFDGKFEGTNNSSSTWSGLVGWIYSATIKICNSLFAPASVDINGTLYSIYGKYNVFNESGSTFKNLYTTMAGISSTQATQATTAELSDGTTATALQNSRAEDVWVQDPVNNLPMLKLFATKAYTVPFSGIGTFSAKAKFALPDGLNAYYCKNYDEKNTTIAAFAINGAVPANTGVILKGEPGETYTLTGTNSEAASVTDNALVAVTEQTVITQTVKIGDVEYTNFGLSDGVFKKVNSSGGTVKANRAYLQIPSNDLSSAAEGIMLVWDEETDGIEIVQTSTVKSQHDDAWFTLDGRQLSGKPTAKGLYIVNGKKVIIK